MNWTVLNKFAIFLFAFDVGGKKSGVNFYSGEIFACHCDLGKNFEKRNNRYEINLKLKL